MIRTSALLLATLTFAASAHAQLGLYGTATVTSMTGLQSSPLVTSGTPYRSAIDPLGLTGGVYYDFRSLGPIRLGADLRATHQTSRRGAQQAAEDSGARLYSFLGGARFSLRTPYKKVINPYAELAAGLARTDYGILVNLPTVSTSTSTGSAGQVVITSNFQYNVFAGVDFRIAPFLDFRAVELGYGGLDPFGTYAHNYPLKSISSGVVFHFGSN